MGALGKNVIEMQQSHFLELQTCVHGLLDNFSEELRILLGLKINNRPIMIPAQKLPTLERYMSCTIDYQHPKGGPLTSINSPSPTPIKNKFIVFTLSKYF